MHVFVLDATLALPAPFVEVEMVSFRREQVLWNGRTDADGYVFAPALADGAAVVRLAAWRRGGDGSAAAMVDLRMASPRRESVVVLAEPEPLVTCRFHLRAAADQAVERGICLLLRRVDGGRAAVMPISPRVAPGDSEQEVAVPRGLYRVVAMPQGVARLDGADSAIEVREGGANEWQIRVQGNGVRSLELAGIGDEVMPIVVRLYRDDDLLEPADLRAWIGPPQWHRRREIVSLGEERTRVLVSSRLGFWLGKPVPAQGDVIVELIRRARWRC